MPPKSGVSKFSQAWEGDGVNVEEYLKNLRGPLCAKLQSALARQCQGFGTPSRKKMDEPEVEYEGSDHLT